MARTRIKVCGICSVDDALDAIEAGVDAIGMVFYEKSPRHISLEQASAITAAVPPFVTTVGLFVDSDVQFIEKVISQAGIDLLQFHGDEEESFCSRFGRPYIKALRMTQQTNVQDFCKSYHTAKGLLIDSFTPGIPGGTGKTFDWNLIPAEIPLPVILAGGLNSDNVIEALSQVKPWAVDVSSGVEESPGKKNLRKIRQFVQAVEAVSRQ